MPFMYILKCSNGCFYTGSTVNLDQRYRQHLLGCGSKYTARFMPVELVYFEEYDRIEDAYRRERQIHGWSHEKKQALIDGNESRLFELSNFRGNDLIS